MNQPSASASAIQTPAQGGGQSGIGIILVIAVAVIGLLILFSGSEERAINRSATGFQGLVRWLDTNGIEARSFSGGGRLVRDEIALRILPLHDTDLDEERERPDSREEVIAQTSERDISRWVLWRKVLNVPTLVILPKWRGGMRKLGVAHKDLLIPEQEINRVAGQVTGKRDVRIRRDPGGFISEKPKGGRAQVGLMHPQTMRAPGCTPILGTREHILLAECPTGSILPEKPKEGVATPAPPTLDEDDQTTFLLLSDPDLLSNHGLNWDGNAEIATQIVRRYQLDYPVILDLTNDIVTVRDDWNSRHHERTWEDFNRMFAWPFTMIWIAFAFLGALVLWRAMTRYGPLVRVYEDEPMASKEVSIDAKARLLRLSNHDAPLLESHIKARLQHLAAEILGPHRPMDRDPLNVLTALIARRNPDLAEELTAASSLPATNTAQTPTDIIRRLDRFENCYDKVTHEFGRTSDAG